MTPEQGSSAWTRDESAGEVNHPVVIPVPYEVWSVVREFLLRGATGRVTWHVERGLVQMVESTEFTRRTKRSTAQAANSTRQ